MAIYFNISTFVSIHIIIHYITIDKLQPEVENKKKNMPFKTNSSLLLKTVYIKGKNQLLALSFK